jgi:hypothetical protein
MEAETEQRQEQQETSTGHGDVRIFLVDKNGALEVGKSWNWV